MTFLTAQPAFRMPSSIPEEKRIDFCIEIINKYRGELVPLRKHLSIYQKQKDHWEEKVRYWQEQYKEKVKEIGILQKEKEKLKKEIEKLTKTNQRYQVALFDHGNFTHPYTKDKKPKGGQKGHTDTNREKHEDYKTYGHKRVFAKTCGKCGCLLTRVNSIRKKILLDIVIHPEVVKLIIESERQWCNNCQKEVLAKDPQTLPFTEYGINTFMMVMILRFKSHASFANIAAVIRIGYGLSLSQSDISNLLRMAANYLGKKYEELKKAVRKGKVMYNDETGWMVAGQKAWMWIMANEKETVYVAAESRGKGIAEELYGNSNGYAMTDGLASYINAIPEEKHLYCWSHVLRFSFEETIHLLKEHLACQIRDRLVDLYQTIRNHCEWTKEQKEQVLRKEIDSLLSIPSTDQAVKNIQYRLHAQKEGLIRALLVTGDGTNNLAERELRNMAIKRTVSHGSDTFKGMENTAIIGSVLQTLTRDKEVSFMPTLQTYLQQGVQEKYRQYLHIAYYDDS